MTLLFVSASRRIRILRLHLCRDYRTSTPLSLYRYQYSTSLRLVPPIVVGSLTGRSWESANCETTLREPVTRETTAIVKIQEPSGWKRLYRKVLNAFRLWRRFIKLLIALTPVFALYPIQRLSNTAKEHQDAHDLVLDTKQVEGPLGWYLQLCLYCVEWSGAAVIKLMQWAGSRPDLFGQDFCAVFSRLQDDTTPHSWRHTELVMREAYGNDWQDHIRLGQVIGSGCIGQVYEGVIKDKEGREKRVAVKVLHPNVEEDIHSDLQLMRLAASFFQERLKYLNLEGFVDEFASLLKVQLDLRAEADHLVRFNQNFANEKDVLFPKLVEGYKPTKDVLIETFCDGVPILQFARDNQDDQELLRTMCYTGIRAICKMIFVDNFLHGDLHPGNVFVSRKDHKIIVLDVGMVTEFTDSDHRLIVNILTSFIRKDGRRAGRLMIDDSNMRNATDQAEAEELYIDKIGALTDQAHGKDYFMEHLGTYISYICEAAATHHVMMNQAFVSAALAIKIQEGIALALDPNVNIYLIANPIILQSEFKRKMSDIVNGLKATALETKKEIGTWMG